MPFRRIVTARLAAVAGSSTGGEEPVESDERVGGEGHAGDPNEGSGEPESLSRDDLFHVLQTGRRRAVLRYLRDAEADGPVRLRDLADHIAALEEDTTAEAVSSSARQRVYISLYQTHLPKLDEEGIVDYDKDRGLVERTPLAATFDPYLEESVDEGSVTGDDGATSGTDPWGRRYAGATTVGAVVLAATATGIAPLSGLVAGAVVLGTFGTLSAAQLVFD